MVRFSLFLISLILLNSAFSQNSFSEHIISSSHEIFTEQYQLDTSRTFVVINSKFGEDELAKVDLSSARITGIDYVSTKHQSSVSFSQYELDRSRINALVRSNYFLKSYDYLSWNFYRQTGCDNSWDCKNYFHGFVIYYTPQPTKESMDAEIADLLDFSEEMDFHAKESDSLAVIYTQIYSTHEPKLNSQRSFVASWKKRRKKKIKLKEPVDFEGEIGKNGRLKSIHIPKVVGRQHEMFVRYFRRSVTWQAPKVGNWKSGAKVKGKISFPINENSITITCYDFEYDTTHLDSLGIFDENLVGYKSFKYFPFLIKRFNPKVVSSVLERNKTKWNNLSLVIDVTGSMSPYNKGMLLWLKLSVLNEVKSVTFFNDGDDRIRKPIDRTRGIYSVRSNDFQKISETMIHAMRQGGGGDCPENNFEALLSAQKQCPQCEDFVMVADNYAFPRDQVLLSKFKGKLKLIVCGADYGINPKYLDLARRYRFSIHTMERDISNLMNMHEGQSITIDGIEYTIVGGKFKQQGSV